MPTTLRIKKIRATASRHDAGDSLLLAYQAIRQEIVRRAAFDNGLPCTSDIDGDYMNLSFVGKPYVMLQIARCLNEMGVSGLTFECNDEKLGQELRDLGMEVLFWDETEAE